MRLNTEQKNVAKKLGLAFRNKNMVNRVTDDSALRDLSDSMAHFNGAGNMQREFWQVVFANMARED